MPAPRRACRRNYLMNMQSRAHRRRRAIGGFVFVLALGVLACPGRGEPRGGQLYYNQDSTQFFWEAELLPGKAGEMIDRYVDRVADAGVTVFLCNPNARRTNYRSQVWEAFWDGYDPAGTDDQPFLKPIPGAQIPAYRKGIGNMLRVHQEGVDYPAR